MSERHRVYRDSDGVRKTIIWDDEDPSRFSIKTEQDLTEILSGIERDRELSYGQRAGDIEPTHRIPRIIYDQLKASGIADDDDAFRKWLNSSEATPWRIRSGTV